MNQNNNQEQDINSKLNFSNYQNIPTREEYLKSIQNQQSNNIDQEISSLNQNINNQVTNNELQRPKTINEQITSSYNQMYNMNVQNQQQQVNQNITGINNVNNQNINLQNNIMNQEIINQQSVVNTPNNQISSGVNNNNNYNVDEEFSVPKKKPIGIILIIVLLLVSVGGILFYFLVLDNPKTIFSQTINSLSKSVTNVNLNNQENLEKVNLEYDIGFNFLTSDKDSQQVYDLFNDITLNMKLGMDKNEEKVSLILNPKYKNKDVINIHLLAEAIENGKTYLKLDDLYDKVIYVEGTDDTLKEDNSNEEISISSVSLDDYKSLLSSVINNFKDTLNTATYKKEYVKLNDKYVKKISLILDNEFMTTLYGKLINDSEFVDNYAKISGLTEEEVVDELNYQISELDEDTYELCSLYLSILSNEFIMFEDDAGEDGVLKITKEDNKYNFEYEQDYTLLYQGHFKYENNDDKSMLSVNLDSIEDELSVELNIDMITNKDMGIDEFDTKESVNIDDLSDDDMNKIIEKFLSNEAVKSFLSDTGLDYYLTMQNPEI